MKKIKSIIMLGLLVTTILNFDSVLIGTMKTVDCIGTTLNVPTIELIDGLNTIYYNLGYK